MKQGEAVTHVQFGVGINIGGEVVTSVDANSHGKRYRCTVGVAAHAAGVLIEWEHAHDAKKAKETILVPFANILSMTVRTPKPEVKPEPAKVAK